MPHKQMAKTKYVQYSFKIYVHILVCNFNIIKSKYYLQYQIHCFPLPLQPVNYATNHEAI